MYTFICDYRQKTNKYSNDRKDRQKWQQCQPTNITDRNIKKLLLHPFNGLLYRTYWVRWYQKGKISQEIMGFWDGSGISWTICKQSAPCSRQITTPTPHHSSDKKLSYRRGTAAMRRLNWNLANCHATVQKLLIRQVLTKSMVWSWRFSRRQCVIDNVHSTMTRPSRFHCLRCVINKPTTDDLCISPVYRRLAVAKFSKSTM